MAQFNYGRMQNLASKLLTDFNQGIIELVQLTPGTGPVHNPGPSTEIKTTLKGAVSPAKGSVLFAPNTLIRMGDLKVSAKVEALATEPKPGDQMKINGETYAIIQFNKIPASGVTVAWVFYVRR